MGMGETKEFSKECGGEKGDEDRLLSLFQILKCQRQMFSGDLAACLETCNRHLIEFIAEILILQRLPRDLAQRSGGDFLQRFQRHVAQISSNQIPMVFS